MSLTSLVLDSSLNSLLYALVPNKKKDANSLKIIIHFDLYVNPSCCLVKFT